MKNELHCRPNYEKVAAAAAVAAVTCDQFGQKQPEQIKNMVLNIIEKSI